MRTDRAAGAAAVLMGLLVMWLSSEHSMGDFSNMGPAYFPVLIATVLLLLGLISLVFPQDQDTMETPDWRAVIILMSNLVLFSFSITITNLFVSTAILMLGLLIWFHDVGWKKISLMVLGLALTAQLIFVELLGINLGA